MTNRTIFILFLEKNKLIEQIGDLKVVVKTKLEL